MTANTDSKRAVDYAISQESHSRWHATARSYAISAGREGPCLANKKLDREIGQ